MDLYLFHHDDYMYYYNCSKYSSEEWTSFGVRQTGIGIFSIVSGVISMALYVPCMKVMLQPKQWSFSCYRLMFLTGIIDVIGIVNSCFLSGYLSLQGVVFCTYPDFLYIYGTVIVSLFGAQGVAAVVLAFNRCMEFWQIRSIFEGKYMIIWWMIPTVHFLLMVFYVAGCPFSSIANMWMIDPYFGIPGIKADRKPYENVPILNFTNLFNFLGLTTCYVFLLFSLWFKHRGGSIPVGRFQRQITIQAGLICSVIYLCAGLYVFYELFPTALPPFFLTIDFFLWQWGCCGVIFVYMTMNRALRNGVIEFYLKCFGYAPPHPHMQSSAVHPTGSVQRTTQAFCC